MKKAAARRRELMNPDLQFALQLAGVADDLAMKRFGSASLSVRTKSDSTPVSEVDEAAERLIRNRIERERPGDAVVGEEFGARGPRDTARRWIIDPIDGTKNYVRGIPVFATLIALEEHRRVTVGVVSAPALGRRWWASAGDGAFCNGKRIYASNVRSLEEAHLSYDSIADFEQAGLRAPFIDLVRRCERSRAFGDFWSHMLVAEGAIEIAIEPKVSLWDMAPIEIIVNEAGGRFTDIQGHPTPDGGSGVSTNGHLHDAVIQFFA